MILAHRASAVEITDVQQRMGRLAVDRPARGRPFGLAQVFQQEPGPGPNPLRRHGLLSAGVSTVRRSVTVVPLGSAVCRIETHSPALTVSGISRVPGAVK